MQSDPERIYKITHGDNFGCRSHFSKSDPELTGRHFHGTGNADPFFYLTRWWLLNQITRYQTRFEGFLLPAHSGHLPRICISQPELDRREPNRNHIRNALKDFGFVEISEDAYLNSDTRILLTDAAPRNVRIVDGIPVPFDAIAQIASDELLTWAADRL